MPEAGKLAGYFATFAASCCVAAPAPPSHVSLNVADESLVDGIGRAVDGSGTESHLQSLLVSRNGRIVIERYFNGFGPDDLQNVKSVSKSILSALVGIAIHNGAIPGVETTLAHYFGDAVPLRQDPAKARITVENLLTMQAGMRSTSNGDYGPWILSDNWVEAALSRPLDGIPGRDMLYSTGNSHLMSAILTLATNRSTLEFARETLGEPLGITLAAWPRDPQGVYLGGNNMELTARQMLAFGELYINGGRSGDRQVIPEAWVEASLAPRAKSPHGDGRYYGYGWWICRLAGYSVPHAWGHGGQFIMLVPDLDLVLVATSSPAGGPLAHQRANGVYQMLQSVIGSVRRVSERTDRHLRLASP